MSGLISGAGSECNRVNIGGVTTLLGDPTIKREKPYTIVRFPGGDVEIARCEDGTYWVHVSTRREQSGQDALIIGARLDADCRYADQANAALSLEIEQADVRHIAFRVRPFVARATPIDVTEQMGEEDA